MCRGPITTSQISSQEQVQTFMQSISVNPLSFLHTGTHAKVRARHINFRACAASCTRLSAFTSTTQKLPSRLASFKEHWPKWTQFPIPELPHKVLWRWHFGSSPHNSNMLAWYMLRVMCCGNTYSVAIGRSKLQFVFVKRSRLFSLTDVAALDL